MHHEEVQSDAGKCPFHRSKTETPAVHTRCPFGELELLEAARATHLKAQQEALIAPLILGRLIEMSTNNPELIEVLEGLAPVSPSKLARAVMEIPESACYIDSETQRKITQSERPGLSAFQTLVHYQTLSKAEVLNGEMEKLFPDDQIMNRVRAETQEQLVELIRAYRETFRRKRGSVDVVLFPDFNPQSPPTAIEKIPSAQLAQRSGVSEVRGLCTALRLVEDFAHKQFILQEMPRELSLDDDIQRAARLLAFKHSDLFQTIANGPGSANILIFESLGLLFEHFEARGYPDSSIDETLAAHAEFIWDFTKHSFKTFIEFTFITQGEKDPNYEPVRSHLTGEPYRDHDGPGDPRSSRLNPKYFCFREKETAQGVKIPILDLNLASFTLDEIVRMRTSGLRLNCPANEAGMNREFIPFSFSLFRKAYQGLCEHRSQ